MVSFFDYSGYSTDYAYTLYKREEYEGGQKKMDKKKVGGVVLALLGAIVMIVGVCVILVGGNSSKLEEGEPVDIYYATETDEYSYALIQYMTESVACYEALESLQFYIVYDKEWNPAVICVQDDMLDSYQPYIDWFYSDSYENEPVQMQVTGYAQPFDAELYEFVEEFFVYDWGEEVMEGTTIEEYFGEYYLQVGEKNGAYDVTNRGIYLMLAAIVIIVIGGALLYEKPVVVIDYGPVIESGRTGLGILGALLGAVLGGLLWAVVGALGYISGWLGVLIMFFAYKGYEILSRRTDRIGVVISIILGLAVIFPATYLSYGWIYYCAVNESVSGYTTLPRALIELADYMGKIDGWSDFTRDTLMGYAFMLVAGIYYLVGQGSNRNR